MSKSFILIVFALFALVSPAFGQRPATQPQPRPPAATTAGAVPTSKVAVIFSGAFRDPKNGIARFNATFTKLDAEFQKTQVELNQTAQRLRQVQTEIANLQKSGTATPIQIQAKVNQFDEENKNYKRRGEDAKAAYQRRYAELMGPLQQDVTVALDAYAKANGITMLVDGSRLGDALIFVADSADVTRAFIADYNRKNPVTTSAAPPK